MLRLAIAMFIIAVPASAQSWRWNHAPDGPNDVFSGQGAAEGWNGNSYHDGDLTFSHFNGPNGEHKDCVTTQLGDSESTTCQ